MQGTWFKWKLCAWRLKWFYISNSHRILGFLTENGCDKKLTILVSLLLVLGFSTDLIVADQLDVIQ